MMSTSYCIRAGALSVKTQIVSCGEEPTTAAHVRWYAVYTCANREKHVADRLASRGIEHFLPQYESMRYWKDRKVCLQLPLFPGYLFVHLALQNRLSILQVPGVVRLVGFDGHATPLADEEVVWVRAILSQRLQAEPHRYLQVGKWARVVCGPLQGMEGIVVRRKNRSRLVLSFALIQRSVAIEMNEGDLGPVCEAETTLRKVAGPQVEKPCLVAGGRAEKMAAFQ
jgi:transcriptional antiterminator NusG